MNILTFDTEEWFHLLDNDSTKSEYQWDNFEVRIYRNVDKILQILDDTDTKATFFVIGWVAKKYPDLVKRIAQKYEIGCHTMNHQLVWQQTRDEFREDVYASKALLEDVTGKSIVSFRAPGFSIRSTETWAFDILAELGFTTDCSIFPAEHAHGGMPEYQAWGPAIIERNGFELKEFPITYKKIVGKNTVFSGGGYFRLFPYCLIKKWTSQQSDYLMSYIHPRDLDAGQPMIKDLSLGRKFRSYYGLANTEYKLRCWLNDFNFVDLKTADALIDWKKVNKIKL